MKYPVAILLLGCLVVLDSCQNSIQQEGEFNLLPQPQEISIRGTSALSVEDVTHYFNADICIRSGVHLVES